jgi:CheY-like chemotaxis protein
MSGTGFEKLSVLIVDDNPHMRAILRALLDGAGLHQVAEAGDGTQALAILNKQPVDLVLTDMAMSPMDGIELTRRVRKDVDSPNPFLPIIMVTGHADAAHVIAARDAGVTEFLAKPLTSQNLMNRITEIMQRPRNFVRCDGYFGPDRRRRRADGYAGPWRRRDDQCEVELR